MKCKCSRYNSCCSNIYYKVRPIVSATLQLWSNFALMLNCWLPGILCQNELKPKPIKRINNITVCFCMTFTMKEVVAVTNINFKWLKSCVCIRLWCCMRVVWTKGNVQKSIAARKTKTCSEFTQSEILRSLQDVYDYGTLTLSDVSICTVSSWVPASYYKYRDVSNLKAYCLFITRVLTIICTYVQRIGPSL